MVRKRTRKYPNNVTNVILRICIKNAYEHELAKLLLGELAHPTVHEQAMRCHELADRVKAVSIATEGKNDEPTLRQKACSNFPKRERPKIAADNQALMPPTTFSQSVIRVRFPASGSPN